MPARAIPFLVSGACLLTILLVIPEVFLPDANLGWVDAWYYVSFSLALPERLPRYYYLYQSERLVWTLPLYLTHKIASPLVANYLVKSVLLVASLWFLFAGLRRVCSVRTAAFVTALAGVYAFYLHSVGSHYVDGVANVCLLAAIFFANKAAHGESSPVRYSVLAGLAYLALLQSHFVFIVVAPMFVVYIIVARLQAGQRDIAGFEIIVCGLLAGLFIGYAAMVALYFRWGIDAPPLWTSLRVLYSHDANELIQPISLRWLTVAYWLVLPFSVASWIALAVWRASRQGWRAIARLPAYYLFFLMMLGFWSSVYFIEAPWIMVPFYASCLLPLTFLALGPLLTSAIDQLSVRAYGFLFGSLFVASALGYGLSHPEFAGTAAVVAIACIGTATLLLAGVGGHKDWQPGAVVLLLIVAMGSINFAAADNSQQVRNGYKYTAMQKIYPDAVVGSQWDISRAQLFDAAITVSERIRPRLAGHYVMFWYDGSERLGMFFRSIASLYYAWSTETLVNETFRGIDVAITRQWPKKGSPVPGLLILTTSASVPASDRRFSLHWTEQFETSGVRYYAHYFVPEAEVKNVAGPLAGKVIATTPQARVF